MAAIKEAVIAEDHTPGLETTIFYTDIRAFGKDFDRYYERAKADGVRFVRSMVSRVVEMPGTKNLRLSYIKDGKPVDEEFDLVVLSTGMRPSEEACGPRRLSASSSTSAVSASRTSSRRSRPHARACSSRARSRSRRISPRP